MQRVWTGLIGLGVVMGVGACGGSEPEPQQPTAQQPTAQAPTYQAPPPATPVTSAPVATPPPAGTMSQPAPIAFPCQSDAQCLAHRCNLQFGKCAWPCQSNADCQAGFQCLAPACIPLPPTQ